MIPYSILDLSPIIEGATAADALRNSVSLAKHAERLGYRRFWLAEHHNMPGIASAATAVVIGHVACSTRTIRVGAGGVMLPNHAPLVIAEQFGTLESLYPGRIDLGLGRAPGTDVLTARALRRELKDSDVQFPRDVQELLAYFDEAQPGQKIRAIPGVGLKVPVWLLGSSLFSAQLAAMLGLPFAFASHFAPDLLVPALDVYRSEFRPSTRLDRPYAMVGANVVAADSDEEALRLFTSIQQSFLTLRRGMPGQLPPPIERIEDFATEEERAGINRALAVSFVGSRESVRQALISFLRAINPDELIITGHIHDHDARLRSFEIYADLMRTIAAGLDSSAA
ncbi:MAG: LLM class flavin-dependent oxidoreductase [Aestuariivirgaceae bacterium]